MRETDAAQDVRLEKPPPILIRDRRKLLGFEDGEIINQNLYFGISLKELVSGLRLAEIAGEALYQGIRKLLFDSGDGRVDPCLSPAIDNDFRAFARQSLSDSEAYSGGRTAHQSRFPSKLQVHVGLPLAIALFYHQLYIDIAARGVG